MYLWLPLYNRTGVPSLDRVWIGDRCLDRSTVTRARAPRQAARQEHVAAARVQAIQRGRVQRRALRPAPPGPRQRAATRAGGSPRPGKGAAPAPRPEAGGVPAAGDGEGDGAGDGGGARERVLEAQLAAAVAGKEAVKAKTASLLEDMQVHH